MPSDFYEKSTFGTRDVERTRFLLVIVNYTARNENGLATNQSLFKLPKTDWFESYKLLN